MRSAPIISDHLGWLSAVVAAIRADITCALSKLLISMLETSLVSMSGPLHQKIPLKAQQSQSYGSFFFVCIPVLTHCSWHVKHTSFRHQLLSRLTRIGNQFPITLLEEMVLFRTRNGSIPCFIYGTPKWIYIEPFFL